MPKTLELAKALISRPSISPKDEGCQELLIDRLENLGFTIENLPFEDVTNFWATKGSSSPMVVFAGHTDVVPPGPEDEWHTPPFEPTVRDGHLYGRGAADMKSSLAAMITATERFVEKNPDYNGSIGFLITSDEEAVATNGTVKVVDHLIQKGTKIDYCIIGEASSETNFGDTIKNGRRGSFHGTLTINGIQAHIAYPQQGDNPIHTCGKILEKLCDIKWDEGNKYFPPTNFQISNIHSGTGADNVIPGSLELKFNLRYSPEITENEIKERITKVLDEAKINYKIEWRLSGEPFITIDGQLTNAVTTAIHSVTSVQAQLSTSGGTSDGRFIRKMGCQVLEFGPINASIHKINERINIEDLDKLSEIYEATLVNLLAK